jgi:hypothetical protein
MTTWKHGEKAQKKKKKNKKMTTESELEMWKVPKWS